MPKFKQRPIILYVEEIDFGIHHLELGERITVIDVEITRDMANSIIEQLQRRIDSEIHLSAIRLRLSGRVVVP